MWLAAIDRLCLCERRMGAAAQGGAVGVPSWIAARIADKSALAARVQYARAARRCKRADRRERAPLLQLVNRTGGRVVLSREGVEGSRSVRCGTAKRFACTAEASVPEGVVGALSYEF